MQWEHRDKNSPYVLTNHKTGQKYTTRRLFMGKLCKKTGLKPFTIKVLRTLGPSVLNDVHKVSMKKLQKLPRYKSQTTTEIYLKNIDDDLASAVRPFDKKPTPKEKEVNLTELTP